MLRATALHPVSNDAAPTIEMSQPYGVKLTLEGTTPIIFHRWSVEAVDAKAKAAKNSRAKKEDNLESYVWRDERGMICLPGHYVHGSLIGAAKFMQDPRSPRKSAMDLFRAGIVMQTELASLGKDTWEYVDQRRVTVQRNGITRARPAFHKGWRATFELTVILPEYITRDVLGLALQNAGRLVGLADYRPTYGRFQVVEFR